MTPIKNISLFLLLTILVSATSCKTKQIVAEKEETDAAMQKREQELSNAVEDLNIEDVSAMIDEVSKIDQELINFLNTNPSADEKSRRLRELQVLRNEKVKSYMTPEQYTAYRKALKDASKKKSTTLGKPLRNPNG